jgi:hypothetical protein
MIVILSEASRSSIARGAVEGSVVYFTIKSVNQKSRAPARLFSHLDESRRPTAQHLVAMPGFASMAAVKSTIRDLKKSPAKADHARALTENP